MARRSSLLTLAVVMMVVVTTACFLPTASVYASDSNSYRIPIAIIERSGNDLHDYAVKIILNSTNFDGWDYVSDDGSDIYFVNSNGMPLYYWIEYFSKAEKKAVIWVKVPYIPARSQITIYMCFGGTNPYANYNNPYKVFTVYFGGYQSDIDEGNWSISVHNAPEPIIGGGVAKWYGTFDYDTYSIIYKDSVTLTLPHRIVFRGKASYSSISSGSIHVLRLDLFRADGCAYHIEFQADGHLTLKKYCPGQGDVTLASATFTWGEWYTFRIDIDPAGEATIVVEDELGHVVLSSAVSFSTYERTDIGFGVHSWYSGSATLEAYVDYYLLRKYVDPEPSIIVGSVTAIVSRGIYRVPITVIERSGNNLYNYSIRLELNSSNFPYLTHVSADASDIYFTDSEGRPLYYWIENVLNTYSTVVIPRGDQNSGVYWRYVYDVSVPSDWYSPTFDDSSWSVGSTPIGDTGSYRTWCNFVDLYARKVVTIPSTVTINGVERKVAKIVKAILKIASDDGADAWVNGHQVLSDSASDHAYSYWNYQIDVTPYVQVGNNTIAIHVHDSGGRNYFDAELDVEVELDHPLDIVVWVKVPFIPANGRATIYMHYGGTNPYASYNDRDKVLILYDDFSTMDTSKWEWNNYWVVEYGCLKQIDADGGHTLWSAGDLNARITSSVGVVIETYAKNLGTCLAYDMAIWWDNDNNHTVYSGIDVAVGKYDRWHVWGTDVPYPWTNFGEPDERQNHLYKVVLYDGKWLLYIDGKLYSSVSANISKLAAIGVYSKGQSVWDWIIVRYYVDPEPSVSIGSEELERIVALPPETMYLVHDIVYSPNSTQFSFSFTAANTTTAGYETSYGDVYGWRVYAEPFQYGGVARVNNASLVAEVNITLPYSQVRVANVTLLARAIGAGAFRQLWIRVLNSTGSVVAELVNASVGTSWTEVVLPIDANLSGRITLWINATVESTIATGEEIDVKDVRVYVEYVANPVVEVFWVPNVDYFNCFARFLVELGSTEYLNYSIITFKLIQFLTYNATSYPVQPVYVGNETIGSYNYCVYRIEPANYSQYLTVYALLPNEIKTFRTHVKGLDTNAVLVGEPLTIELPMTGNVTVLKLKKTFVNVSVVTLRFFEPGAYTIEANTSQPSLWRLGYSAKTVHVGYGALEVKPIDIDSRVIDYEDLVIELVNETSGAVVKELSGNKLISLSGLPAGNYSLVIKFKDVVVGATPFELNITTNGSVITVPCTVMRLAKDYRGFNKTIVYEMGKQLLGVENLSRKYPYSRMMILLNGTGSFKLYIDYRGDPPTKVEVTGNVTGLKYYWDGRCLVVEGVLGSVGEINVTDLYKLRIELYDRLGHVLPLKPTILINGSSFVGPVVETYLYPEDYVIELPKNVAGFELYGFFDGYNGSVRAVAINNSDVVLKAWYRVPTRVESLGGVKIARVFGVPFVAENETTIYIEGYLKDYYGEGVPNRVVRIEIVDTMSGYSVVLNAVTDASGYFRTEPVTLLSGHVYKVVVRFDGDDVYVGTTGSFELKPSELPTRYLPSLNPEQILLIVTGVVVAVALVAAVRSARHVIERIAVKRFVERR